MSAEVAGLNSNHKKILNSPALDLLPCVQRLKPSCFITCRHIIPFISLHFLRDFALKKESFLVVLFNLNLLPFPYPCPLRVAVIEASLSFYARFIILKCMFQIPNLLSISVFRFFLFYFIFYLFLVLICSNWGFCL